MRSSTAQRWGEVNKPVRSEEHTSELQPQSKLVCRLLLEKKNENDSAFAETNIFIADSRRSPAPRFPASKQAANEPRVSARADAFIRDVLPPPGDVILIQEFIGACSHRTLFLRQ